jgi:hypothetical protein
MHAIDLRTALSMAGFVASSAFLFSVTLVW